MTLIIFRRPTGWFWRLVARNKRIVAIGAEPFASARNAERSFHRMFQAAHTGTFKLVVRR